MTVIEVVKRVRKAETDKKKKSDFQGVILLMMKLDYTDARRDDGDNSQWLHWGDDSEHNSRVVDNNKINDTDTKRNDDDDDSSDCAHMMMMSKIVRLVMVLKTKMKGA